MPEQKKKGAKKRPTASGWFFSNMQEPNKNGGAKRFYVKVRSRNTKKKSSDPNAS